MVSSGRRFSGNPVTHITLLLTASPEIGLIWYKLQEGAVKSEDILQLYRDTAKASVEHKPLSGFTSYKISERSAFIVDNALNHHKRCFAEYSTKDRETVKKYLDLEFLLSSSPFLNPVEQMFNFISFNLYNPMSRSQAKIESKAAIKEKLEKEITDSREANPTHDIIRAHL